MSALTGSALTCVRGDRLVFRDLDFGVEAGQALVLVGANGSGKSSLLRIMAGLLRPFAGTLAWAGQPVAEDREAHARRLHYVGHADAVKPVLSVRDNLMFWSALSGSAAPAADAAAALERLGLASLAAVPGRYLSAGQRRRLNLARILAVPRPIWLLDEPTVALDRGAVGLLEAEIARHRDAGGLVVASTHAEIALPGARVLDLAVAQADVRDEVDADRPAADWAGLPA